MGSACGTQNGGGSSRIYVEDSKSSFRPPANENELRAAYKKYGQSQVFRFVDAGMVNEDDKARLYKQLGEIDLQFVNRLFRDTMAGSQEVDNTLEPMEDVAELASVSKRNKTRWFNRGLHAVAAGEVAALVLAGGQGSRLGFDRPKGEYDLSLPSHKTLFQIMSDKIKRVRELAALASGMDFEDIKLPWYIMTSPMTHAQTVEFFEANNNFGLGKDGVFMFSQGTLPCFTAEGMIMLESASKVAKAPDGNGGIYRGLHMSGAIARMSKDGTKYIHAFAVDNAVCKVADPLWIGYCIDKKADMGCKVVRKTRPDEKVGLLCRKGGKFAVVEYSDIDHVNKNRRNEDGSLTFSAANLCIHFYTLDFLKNKCHPDRLPKEYHIARKKIPHADAATGRTIPKSDLKENTGIKLESFIFDVCALSDAMAALYVTRDEEFSPVKNKEGNDSPATARQIFSDLSVARMQAAGANVIQGEVAGALSELSGLVSYHGESLEAFKGVDVFAPFLVQAQSEAQEGELEGTGRIRVARRGVVNVYTLMDDEE